MYKTIAEIKQANLDRFDRGEQGYWFSKETMRFFRSSVVSGVLHGRYFITSETSPSEECCYTVRECLKDGSIQTIGPFHVHVSEKAAKEYLKRHILNLGEN